MAHRGLLLLFVAAASSTSAPDFPLLPQCGENWSSDLMVTKTICEVGCLMTSVSEGLNGYNITIDGAVADPGPWDAGPWDSGPWDSGP